MDQIGIDLGGRDSQVCVRNSAGTIIEEARRPTTELGRWLANRAPARVVLETCTEAFIFPFGYSATILYGISRSEQKPRISSRFK